MASSTSPVVLVSPFSSIKNLTSFSYSSSSSSSSSSIIRMTPRRKSLTVYMAASSNDDNALPSNPKLVTFLGKGGSGKTTSSVFAAQHYAMTGLKTCLVVHSQDPTAEYLLNCKIGNSPTICAPNLSAIKVESAKMLLEPLNSFKQADARLNMTQGVLEGVVGEELGVLPGMDSIFSALALERLLGYFGNITRQKIIQKEKFDIIIYDGVSTEETIRLIGAAGKARLYLKYIRNLAEKTDLGRLAGPSILRLVDESIGLSSSSSSLNGKSSSELWDYIERLLEMGSSVFGDPNRFGCYLVTDPRSPTCLNTALRYWGCAIQAGAQVSGAFGIGSCAETVKKAFMPLPCASIPHIIMDSPIKWSEVVHDFLSKDAQNLLAGGTSDKSGINRTVKFDPANKSVTLLMPGFEKSEIKLFQYRGGSELLVEAGDQRRVIRLPSQIQGRVGGAKFVDRSIIITMR